MVKLEESRIIYTLVPPRAGGIVFLCSNFTHNFPESVPLQARLKINVRMVNRYAQ